MARIRDTSYDKSVVYEPSEDSFLLADAVAEEIWSREKRKESNALRRLDDDDENDFDDENDEEEEEFVSVEIGVGSGYVLCSHAMRFCEEMKERLQRKQREDDSKKTKKKCRRVWRFIGVDVNEKAVEHAKETMRRHGLRVVGDDVDEEKEDFDEDDSSISSRYSIEIFRGDMLEDDRFYRRRINDEKKKTEEVKEEEREKKPIDVLLFNPPYVVTPSEEIYDPSTKSSSLSSSLTAAWAGGVRGREVVDRILYDIKSWLRPNGGTFLVVAYAQNDIEEMMEILSNQDGMRVERAKWTKADEESLVVLKAVRL
jgi:methylase of polypeptide subunit release factors